MHFLFFIFLFHSIPAFKCGFGNCSETFGSAGLLREHMSESHVPQLSGVHKSNQQSEAKKCGKVTFECYLCRKKSFQAFRMLKNHLKGHDTPSIGKCLVCLTKMYTLQLEVHLCENVTAQANNGDGDSIDCEYCPETKFKSITNILRHIDDKHEKIKTLYRCIKCASTYPLKRLLECHDNVHTKEIFKCNKCSKVRSFETLDALNKHIKRHETKEGKSD